MDEKREEYIKLYTDIVNIFSPRIQIEREAQVKARAVLYRLSSLKGTELEKYIAILENEIKKSFLQGVIT